MSVSKRSRRKIVVRDQDYYWGIKGDYQTLVIVSDDKKFHFFKELSYFRPEFDRRWAGSDPLPPAPEEIPGAAGLFESHFKITPSYIREVIEWCLHNGHPSGSP